MELGSITMGMVYLVHSDVSRPMLTTSMNGSRYFLTFINDYSRYCWMYFLKKKSKVFETFKIVKSLAENTLKKNIKAHRSYNGGEYIKREFQHLCASAGIQMQHSVPYTPHQNGVAKRKNKSLKEMATCLIEARNMPPYMRDEAVNCASYIHNRVPHKLVIGSTPFEAFIGHKPNVSYLEFFGSKEWAKIPTNKRKSFQA